MKKEISKLAVIAVLSVAAQSANAFCGYYGCQQNYLEQQRQLEQQEMYQQRQIANEQMYQQRQIANQYNNGGLNPNSVKLNNYDMGRTFMDSYEQGAYTARRNALMDLEIARLESIAKAEKEAEEAAARKYESSSKMDKLIREARAKYR